MTIVRWFSLLFAIGTILFVSYLAFGDWFHRTEEDIEEERADAAAMQTVARERAPIEENLLCPGIPNPVPEWTDYVAPANTGSPDDWEDSQIISMPACSNASLRSSDDPSTRLVQCKKRGRWPADGQPSQRSECDNVTAVRYLSASSESVFFQYKFVRRK